MHELARRLVALEAETQNEKDEPAGEAVRVCEKLQISLTRFAGTDGFAALLRRALALARADDPSLEGVKVTLEGHLEGLENIGSTAGNAPFEAANAITGHLLVLLATFIGEPLTRRLVRQAWPEALLDE